MIRTIALPSPIPAKDLSDHARRAMRAFERVHEMLKRKGDVAERAKVKRPSRAA